MLKIKQKDIDRFWSKVQKTRGCWNWTGRSFNRDGYGEIGIGGQMGRAHRISWILHFGKIPKKLYVLHKCDNRKCVNSKHLYLGTQFENMRDMIKRNKNINRKGEKNGRHKVSKENVLLIRKIYKETKIFQKELAKKFKLGRSTIGHILRNYTWKHL